MIWNGVICPQCNYLPMERKYGHWCCHNCSYKSKNTHVSAFKDYALLIGPTITNREAREFLQISSDALATRLLQSMNFSFKGSNRFRVYTLSFEE